MAYGRPIVIVEDRNSNFFVAGLEHGCEVTGGTIVTGAAMGRAMDDVVIAALGGTSFTGETGGTSVVLPAAQKPYSSSQADGLTITKLLEAKKILDVNDVDPSIQRYIVCGPKQISDLLGTTQITSADGARMRVSRAINSLIRILGGWRTYVDTDNLEVKEEEDDTRA